MNTLKATIALGLTAATLAFSAPKPALADGAASTRNLILGAAAVIGGLAIESNVARKNARANAVQGYLPDGATVYASGEVVEPNGQAYYPGNQQQTVSCYDQQCRISNDGNGGQNRTWRDRR